jgi:formylglycine-generating enzyme required for sulfatase activity
MDYAAEMKLAVAGVAWQGPALWPFSAEEAVRRQKVTGLTLARPVEFANSIGMPFKLIPAGEFVMGSPDSEEGRRGGETRHPVRITRAYYLGVHAVTQAEYDRVMGMNPSHHQSTAWQDTRRCPVDRVFWPDAAEFCTKLSMLPEERRSGRAYRLPTEAEWEYACRAGSETRWSFGDDTATLGQHAWYRDNSFEVPPSCNGPAIVETESASRWKPAPVLVTPDVGRKQPNAWGLYDMHGHVMEWCADWYGEYALDTVCDPKGPALGAEKVLRGGCRLLIASSCRSAWRYKIPSDGQRRFCDKFISFRIVLVWAVSN